MENVPVRLFKAHFKALTSLHVSVKALLISEGEAEGAFLERLRGLGWSINVAPVSQATCSVQQLRPILLLLDNRIPELPALSRFVVLALTPPVVHTRLSRGGQRFSQCVCQVSYFSARCVCICVCVRVCVVHANAYFACFALCPFAYVRASSVYLQRF
ncbi:hypothetical protein Y032_0035g3046 [Ancylostoma ceylanicum]|uniref:Uncharacterized protein n=1 Tax=Ancylostoma ceylanicum TaxID=53326 RepID=A0A016UM39_9BILA|nr:hypothetical protein Y032_0035g3046 [Ancylostoma ceylanicum]